MALPQHKVAQTLDAAGADEEVERRAVGGEHVLGERLLGDALDVHEARDHGFARRRRRGGGAVGERGRWRGLGGCGEGDDFADGSGDLVARGVREADIEGPPFAGAC